MNGKVRVLTDDAVSGKEFTCYCLGKGGVPRPQTFKVAGGDAVEYDQGMLMQANALFEQMAQYLVSKGSVDVGEPREFAKDLVEQLKGRPAHFHFIVLLEAGGSTLLGYVCAHLCITGGSYIKHLFVDEKARGLNFGALLIGVAERGVFTLLTTFKKKQLAKKVKSKKYAAVEFLRRDRKVFLNFAGDGLDFFYRNLGYKTPAGLDITMIKPSLDKIHCKSLVKNLMGEEDDDPRYLGIREVVVGAPTPLQDQLSANPTPTAHSIKHRCIHPGMPVPADISMTRVRSPSPPLGSPAPPRKRRRARAPESGGGSAAPAPQRPRPSDWAARVACAYAAVVASLRSARVNAAALF